MAVKRDKGKQELVGIWGAELGGKNGEDGEYSFGLLVIDFYVCYK